MSVRSLVRDVVAGSVVAILCAVAGPSPALAQSAPPAPEPAAQAPAPEAASPAGPNAGSVNVTVGLDVASAYMFRGIYQEDTGMITWPAFDLGLTLAQGDGPVKKVAVNFGMWNSLHTGPTGSDGPSDNSWYESDFYASLSFGLGSAFTFSPIYTAYNSPNNTFGTVTEIAFKFAVADAQTLGRFALSPYALVAIELDGKADGGERSGKYPGTRDRPGRAPGGRQGRPHVSSQAGPEPVRLLRGAVGQRHLRLLRRGRRGQRAARVRPPGHVDAPRGG